MMNYIGADGLFINLAAILKVEDVSEDNKPAAVITTITGDEIDMDGDDAEMLLNRCELLTVETATAQLRMQAFNQQTEGTVAP
jgi:hypothetical protein